MELRGSLIYMELSGKKKKGIHELKRPDSCSDKYIRCASDSMKGFRIFPLDHVELLKGFFQKSNLFVVLLEPVSVILVGNEESFYIDSGYLSSLYLPVYQPSMYLSIYLSFYLFNMFEK